MKTGKNSCFETLLFGAPYYPEHWSADCLARDIERMRAAGVNVVRMAEFAWNVIEPERERFDFSLFDRTVEALGSAGIAVILCTPAATPPLWLVRENPSILRVDADGRSMRHGSRQHCCTTSPDFRAESRRITRVMAEHYADVPGVIGWQTDNEFNCHMNACYCSACTEGFREWLRQRYGSVEELNRAWGTAFWAQTYDDFAHIQLPVERRPSEANPGQAADFRRFISASVIRFQREQVEILRKANTGWRLTHNGMFDNIDYREFFADLDIPGVDVYPGFAPSGARAENNGPFWASGLLDKCRAAGGNFLVLEQQSGAGGQNHYMHDFVAPGRARLWAFQSVARGADGILHFRWRTCPYGSEIYWNGILDHDDVPRRRYEEFRREGHELAAVSADVLGTTVKLESGILVDFEQDVLHDASGQDLPSPRVQARALLEAQLAASCPCGLVHARGDWTGLKVVFIPSFLAVDDDLANRITTFVRGGGVAVASARSFTRTFENRVLTETPPGMTRELFGVEVDEFAKSGTASVVLTLDGSEVPASAAFEILKATDADERYAWSAINPEAGYAAQTCGGVMHRVGAGRAVYVGTCFTPENAAQLSAYALRLAAIRPLVQTDPYVEAVVRSAADRELLFLLNHYNDARLVAGLPSGVELLSGESVSGNLTLEPLQVAIIRKERGK